METSLSQNHNPALVQDAYKEFADILFLERGKMSDMNMFFNAVCYTQAELKYLLQQLTDIKKIQPQLSIWKRLFCLSKRSLTLLKTDCYSLLRQCRKRLFQK
jgi:hypothetical protein